MSQPQATISATQTNVASVGTGSLRLWVSIAAATAGFVVGACTEATVHRVQGAAQDSALAVQPARAWQPAAAARDTSVPAAVEVFGSADAATEEPAPTF